MIFIEALAYFKNKAVIKVLLISLTLTQLTYATSSSSIKKVIDDSGALEVPAFSLPVSAFIYSTSVKPFIEDTIRWAEFLQGCGPESLTRRQLSLQACREWHSGALVDKYWQRYDVNVNEKLIGRVKTYIVEPARGVPEKNQSKLLINISSGAAFDSKVGRDFALIEAIPIAAVANIRVISVSLGLDANSRLPLASERVASVYKSVLEHYSADSIGIYGCSFGGLLTAQFIAWLQTTELPAPGAVGMFCMAAAERTGDFVHYVSAMERKPVQTKVISSYFDDTDRLSALYSPATHPKVMGKYPPSLLISSTRDHNLSSIVFTHRKLVMQGVKADLHIWNGLRHGFFYNPDYLESREVYEVVAEFFDKNLAAGKP